MAKPENNEELEAIFQYVTIRVVVVAFFINCCFSLSSYVFDMSLGLKSITQKRGKKQENGNFFQNISLFSRPSRKQTTLILNLDTREKETFLANMHTIIGFRSPSKNVVSNRRAFRLKCWHSEAKQTIKTVKQEFFAENQF